MRRQIHIILLALATVARAAPLFTDDISDQNDGWINRETRAATALTLTREPEGGDTIATIAAGEALGILLADKNGHFLGKTPFGITGWVQARAGEGRSETFPALEQLHDNRLNLDIYYHPERGKALNNHYYYDEAEPDTPSPGLPPEPRKDDPAPVYEIFDRLLETAFTPGGTRYFIDCTVSLNDQHYCLFLPVNEGKIRRLGAAGLLGQTFYFPGNGYAYSDVDDSRSRYYRARQKWILRDGAMQEIEQPYHYLGLTSHYRGILAPDGTHDQKTPLRLTDRIDGNKTVAKIAPGEKITLQLAAPHQNCPQNARIDDGNSCADLWLLIENAAGKTGWTKINYSEKTPDLEGLHGFAR